MIELYIHYKNIHSRKHVPRRKTIEYVSFTIISEMQSINMDKEMIFRHQSI